VQGNTSSSNPTRSSENVSVSSVADVKDGRFVSVFKRGGLVIDPPGSLKTQSPLGMDLALVKRYAALVGGLSWGASVGHDTIGFGLVSLSKVSIPQGMPSFNRTPAWIAIAVPDSNTPYNCPAMRFPPIPAPSNLGPIDQVAIFYGQRGNGVALYDTGGIEPCGGIAEPTLGFASALVNVPWHLVGSAGLKNVISYDTWSCASLASVSVGGKGSVFTVRVSVSVPFLPKGRPGCHPTTATTTVSVVPTHPGPGAPAPPRLPITLLPSKAPELMPAAFRFPPA
jgi:hypothetical protein